MDMIVAPVRTSAPTTHRLLIGLSYVAGSAGTAAAVIEFTAKAVPLYERGAWLRAALGTMLILLLVACSVGFFIVLRSREATARARRAAILGAVYFGGLGVLDLAGGLLFQRPVSAAAGAGIAGAVLLLILTTWLLRRGRKVQRM